MGSKVDQNREGGTLLSCSFILTVCFVTVLFSVADGPTTQARVTHISHSVVKSLHLAADALCR